MVRKRAAIGDPSRRKGADRGARSGRELQALAKADEARHADRGHVRGVQRGDAEYSGAGDDLRAAGGRPLDPDAEAFMRDHQPTDVAFYLVEPVLVHDITFAVVPAAGVEPGRGAGPARTRGHPRRRAEPLRRRPCSRPG